MKGFTLVELIVVVAIFAILASLASVNLFKFQTSTTLDTDLSTFLADLKQTQLKSMMGEAPGSLDTSTYGIFIENSRYTIFRGSSYNPNDSFNFRVDLDQNIAFLDTPTIIFLRRSGEVNAANIRMQNFASGEEKTISINRLGAVSIN